MKRPVVFAVVSLLGLSLMFAACGGGGGTSTAPVSYPTGVAVTPGRRSVYVTDGNTSVWVVDTGSNSVIAKIAAGSEPEAIAITPDGNGGDFDYLRSAVVLGSQ
jgi:YVTN family beta-propeller protein